MPAKVRLVNGGGRAKVRLVGAPGVQGPTGPTGATGPTGPTGPQGLPGVNAVPADEAVAGYAGTEGTATRTALSAAFAPFAGSSEYADADEVQPRQSGIYFAATDLAAVPSTAHASGGGTPVLEVAGAAIGTVVSYWRLNATNIMEISTTFDIPDWWTNVEVDVLWMPLSASGSGVPSLRCGIGTIADNAAPGTIGLGTGGTALPTLPATQYQLTRTTFGPYTPDPTRLGNLRLGRVGNAGADTANTTEIGVVGVVVRQAAA